MDGSIFLQINTSTMRKSQRLRAVHNAYPLSVVSTVESHYQRSGTYQQIGIAEVVSTVESHYQRNLGTGNGSSRSMTDFTAMPQVNHACFVPSF